VKVTAHFSEQGSVLRGDAQGQCNEFEIELNLDSDESAEEIAELIHLAHQMCFTEDALTSQVRISNVNLLNGRPVVGTSSGRPSGRPKVISVSRRSD
jgi:uncharacterized OsmC-like protein